tara:strand:+ start:11683 stop:12462 length:780 start_codon:yes stop_codon:yes gene_type:complete
MTGVVLFPRLSRLAANTLLDHFAGRTPQPAEVVDFLQGGLGNSGFSFAASGGHRMPKAPVELCRALRELAGKSGFPESTDRKSRSQFDCQASAMLADAQYIQSGEAQRDDVWAFMSVVVAPDVVHWRFPDPDRSRFQGGVRNAFQRLWVRGTALDRGKQDPERWALLESLKEDELVQIFERASLAGHPDLARAIAEAAVRAGRGSNSESVTRLAIKLIRLRNEVIDLSAIDADELGATLDAIFGYSAQYLLSKAAGSSN